MRIYKVIISKEAKRDIRHIISYIRDVYKQYITAARYKEELYKTINTISYLAGSIGCNEYVQGMFGADARHINFKKIAIIFTVHGNYAYVERVIPCSLIR
jgi:plasmid stabilization system protein ParE